MRFMSFEHILGMVVNVCNFSVHKAKAVQLESWRPPLATHSETPSPNKHTETHTYPSHEYNIYMN